ncbi:NAD(P)/FAD-dependent oxidoreductase [Gordonia sp. CPCC 205333]|uniref:NAD(P)/FAD-dependent oxidoreductase n=1 Tax=Gordonia sp. CPCC 205333 TaxID=3140790 RepID=UPI003AF35576
MTTSSDTRRRFAVIGSGISGLMAAHVLARNDHVTLFEADDRLGGHAHTHEVPIPDGRSIHVDTGFIVHNRRTYPTLIRLFDELGVQTRESDMSMSVTIPGVGLEYAGGKGIRGLIPTARSLRNRRYLRVLTQVPKFHRAARDLLTETESTPISLRAFLDDIGFDVDFRDFFITPLVSAVWSCDPADALDYPARHLFTFLDHHGMLSISGSPTWRTVVGGSARYVERIADGLPDVRLGTAVSTLTRRSGGVTVTTEAGASEEFDAAVVATHPHQALRMLANPTVRERDLLGAITYSPNRALLHTDESVLPRTANARASWNYLVPQSAKATSGVVVTYDVTRLMRLPSDGPRMLVTLNGSEFIDPATVIDEMAYEHPLFTTSAVSAAARLDEIDSDTMAFAGAYRGWGFHEDGALSGLRAAQRLGGRWTEESTTPVALVGR